MNNFKLLFMLIYNFLAIFWGKMLKIVSYPNKETSENKTFLFTFVSLKDTFCKTQWNRQGGYLVIILG